MDYYGNASRVCIVAGACKDMPGVSDPQLAGYVPHRLIHGDDVPILLQQLKEELIYPVIAGQSTNIFMVYRKFTFALLLRRVVGWAEEFVL